MISPDILFRLVPDEDPEGDFRPEFDRGKLAADGPGRRLGLWAEFLRHRIFREMLDSEMLRDLVETSGFVGTGIFRVPNAQDARDFEGFPIVSGYQFGAILLRAVRIPGATYIGSLDVDGGRFEIPVLQTVATFNPHSAPDGYIAAVFEEDDGTKCGITARHVVDTDRLGQTVPVECSDCGAQTRLRRKAPGLIDAASVEFTCGSPPMFPLHPVSNLCPASEGDTVEAHFGATGKKICTVMQSLSTAAQILCAAAPKHFLTDIHGHPGDSGSLLSEAATATGEPALIGIYLGDADCEDEHQNCVTYGYGLDLHQAARILGAKDLNGEFNV